MNPAARLKAGGITAVIGLGCIPLHLKLLNYTLAAVVGAFIATLVAHRVSNLQSEPAPGVAPIAVQRRAPVGPSQAEFVKLTEEKAALDAQLTEVRTQLAERDAVLTQTKQNLEELRRPMMTDMMSSALRAELKSGEVVVTGGYKLPDGKRLYAFAQPMIEQVDGKDEVKIGVEVFKVTDEQGLSVGLDTIATNAANTIQHGEVWVADEYRSVADKLRSTPGMQGSARTPPITVLPGSSGEINDGDLKLKLTPVISTDHTKMDFEVRLEQPQAPTPVAGAQQVKPAGQAEGAQPPK